MYIDNDVNYRICQLTSTLGVATSITANVSSNGGSNGSASGTFRRYPTHLYSRSGGGTNFTKTRFATGTYTVTLKDSYSFIK
ncbi:MAG TPA: hypothetical protein VNZ45_08325 [Bacteroidia bacterium]|nr:hypothetical protein [Bacteroidia bacterium]